MDMYSIIKSLCDERGISIYEMCKDTGIGRSVISELKAGRSKTLGADKARKIAEYFNVSVDYLLGKTSFRNAQALYEFWGTNDPYFDASFDFGRLIQLKREELEVSLKEMSTALGITESDLDDCEQGILPLNLEWAEKMANFLDTNVSQLLFEHDLYEGKVPEEYHDEVRKWETLVKAAEDEAANDSYEHRKSSANCEELSGMELVKFPVIGSIAAGYDCCALEEYTGDYAYFPSSELSAPADEYFVLRVKGNSMYPKLLENDTVLVRRKQCVDSGKIAVVLYDGEDATVKRVNYISGENWLELVPINPEYQTKRIEGVNLEQCRVLGEVVKLMRDM